MRDWKPIFVENSWVPKVLSWFTPISIGAITLGIVVFSRGVMDDRTRQHETIHFQQFLETMFIGFLVLYCYDYIRGLIKHKDGTTAYYNIRAEQEAYAQEQTLNYLQYRTRWEWIRGYRI